MSYLFNPDYLTPEEKTFLRHHKIDETFLFDARLYSPRGWGDVARDLNLQFGIGTTCKDDHRIRARSGHCVVCSPKNISYLKRENEPGYVYIASSVAGRIHKVGSTVDYKDRQVRLQREAPAGCTDWVIVAWFESPEAQRDERKLQGALSEYRIAATSQKSTGTVTSRELFGPKLRPIFGEFREMVSSRNAKAWRHPKIAEFDFGR